VTNDITIRIVFTFLLALDEWYAHVVDEEGAFLNGRFADKEVLFMEVPEGFETRHNWRNLVLHLRQTNLRIKTSGVCILERSFAGL
jgi:hypothetical protein